MGGKGGKGMPSNGRGAGDDDEDHCDGSDGNEGGPEIISSDDADDVVPPRHVPLGEAGAGAIVWQGGARRFSAIPLSAALLRENLTLFDAPCMANIAFPASDSITARIHARFYLRYNWDGTGGVAPNENGPAAGGSRLHQHAVLESVDGIMRRRC